MSSLIVISILLFIFAGMVGFGELIGRILAYVVLISIFIYCLIISFQFTLNKTKYRKDTSLYQWLDDLSDFDQRLVYSLKRINIGYGTLENLNSLKKILIKQTRNDKSTLKIYRAFYNQKLKDSVTDLYLRTIMISIIPIGVLLAERELDLLGPADILLQSVLIFIIVGFISVRLGINKKRINIIIEMIGLCIEDIEDEEKRLHREERI